MKTIVGIILLIVVCGGVPVVSATDAPVAVDDYYIFLWDSPFNPWIMAPGVLENDFDPAGLPLSAELVSGPSHGTVYLYADGEFWYYPDWYFLGEDSFTYRVWNGQQYSEPECVKVFINHHEYDIPLGNPDTYVTAADTPLNVPAYGVLENDYYRFYPSTSNMGAVLIEDSVHGNLSLRWDGSFTYTPDPGFTGTDRFVYVAEDVLEPKCWFSDYTPVTITVSESVPSVPEFPGQVLAVPGIILGLFGIAVRMRKRR